MMSSPSKKSCSNCLHFSFGHDCTGAVKHEGCSDWKPKDDGNVTVSITGDEGVRMSAAGITIAKMIDSKVSAAEKPKGEKGDWKTLTKTCENCLFHSMRNTPNGQKYCAIEGNHTWTDGESACNDWKPKVESSCDNCLRGELETSGG